MYFCTLYIFLQTDGGLFLKESILMKILVPVTVLHGGIVDRQALKVR